MYTYKAVIQCLKFIIPFVFLFEDLGEVIAATAITAIIYGYENTKLTTFSILSPKHIENTN